MRRAVRHLLEQLRVWRLRRTPAARDALAAARGDLGEMCHPDDRADIDEWGHAHLGR